MPPPSPRGASSRTMHSRRPGRRPAAGPSHYGRSRPGAGPHAKRRGHAGHDKAPQTVGQCGPSPIGSGRRPAAILGSRFPVHASPRCSMLRARRCRWAPRPEARNREMLKRTIAFRPCRRAPSPCRWAAWADEVPDELPARDLGDRRHRSVRRRGDRAHHLRSGRHVRGGPRRPGHRGRLLASGRGRARPAHGELAGVLRRPHDQFRRRARASSRASTSTSTPRRSCSTSSRTAFAR